MPRVTIASALARWIDPARAELSSELSLDAAGETVRAVLDSVFGQRPGLRAYVLDEHGTVRHHVVIFVDGSALRDKRQQLQAVHADSEIYVMQALSGG